MGEPRPLTDAGKARVEAALARHGLLLMQGQWEIPSVADLLEGRPIATRGFSWDYVTAWEYTDVLGRRPDLATTKVFRGRTTLVARPLWGAVARLAWVGRDAVAAGRAGRLHARMLALVEGAPAAGVPGDDLKARVPFDDARTFQRVKSDLEAWLCLEGRGRTDVDYHTHDQSWVPFAESKLARGVDPAELPDTAEEAAAVLLAAIYPDGAPKRGPRVTSLLPVTRW